MKMKKLMCRSTFAIVTCCALLMFGCGVSEEQGLGGHVSSTTQALTNGADVPWGTDGAVTIVNSAQGVTCSAVGMSDIHVITAKHCVEGAAAQNIWIFPGGGGNAVLALKLERHPTEDVAALMFPSQTLPGTYNTLWNDPTLVPKFWKVPDASLVGETLKCYGAGGHLGGMKSASLTVAGYGLSPCGIWQTCGYQTHGYYMSNNALGQGFEGGDSGGPCFARDDSSGIWRVIGIHSETYAGNNWDASTEHFAVWWSNIRMLWMLGLL